LGVRARVIATGCEVLLPGALDTLKRIACRCDVLATSPLWRLLRRQPLVTVAFVKPNPPAALDPPETKRPALANRRKGVQQPLPSRGLSARERANLTVQSRSRERPLSGVLRPSRVAEQQPPSAAGVPVRRLTATKGSRRTKSAELIGGKY